MLLPNGSHVLNEPIFDCVFLGGSCKSYKSRCFVRVETCDQKDFLEESVKDKIVFVNKYSSENLVKHLR